MSQAGGLSTDGDYRPRLALGVRLHRDRHERRWVLLYPEGFLRTSETGTALLRLCNGRRSIDEITAALARIYRKTAGSVRADVIDSLDQLSDRNLVRGGVGVASGEGLEPISSAPVEPGPHDRSSPGEVAAPEHAARTVPRPLGLVAELTYRCPLRCPYCSNPTRYPSGNRELNTEEWLRVFREAEQAGVLHALLSGGEPLVRPDIVELVAGARKAGLYTNLITSGLGLTPGRAARLQAVGLDSVQISLQGDEEGSADRVAGVPAHAAKLRAAQLVHSLGLPLTINVVMHRDNIDQMDRIIALAEALGAHRLELANVQFYGWAARNRAALLPRPAQVERAVATAAEAGARLRGRMTILYVRPDFYDDRPKPCLGGWGRRYLTVNPVGDVLPCATAGEIADLRFDNVRDRPLGQIWTDSEAFNRFRGTSWMPEPCGSCALREIDFGGCRCQAAILTGDAFATDPACALAPGRESLLRARDSETPAALVYRTNP